MKYIHPFPARMAPEIALQRIRTLEPGQTILDPMSGSGVVLSQAVRSGINAVGIDMDPLAELISRVGTTSVVEDDVRKGLAVLIELCSATPHPVSLPWIDEDVETRNFVDFWYAPKQKEQLRRLSFFLMKQRIDIPSCQLDVMKVALSRLIITKEPKASLARDTAHSRPHRTIQSNDFDVLSAMPSSVEHVISALDAASLRSKATTYLGDARKLLTVGSEAIDCIITSPPYLNAIDYMRGHRMSLVWLGYRLKDLREIRGLSIGTERAPNSKVGKRFTELLLEFNLDGLESRHKNMLDRYFSDLLQQTKEAYRVLKPGAVATYVIGNSTIRGTYVQNSELLKRAGVLAGFQVLGETEREIPSHRRYMPMAVAVTNALANRMRTEHIIDFRRPL